MKNMKFQKGHHKRSRLIHQNMMKSSFRYQKVSDAATLAKQRALENPAIATVSTNMTTGLQTGLYFFIDWHLAL